MESLPSGGVGGRFIPAWAGNTQAGGGESSGGSVSSPRGRGTPQSPRRGASGLRFIPAWAGNTRIGAAEYRTVAVHPRVGGEHFDLIITAHPISGSSPRGRGTQSRQRGCRSGSRFIPAWAGNTFPRISSSCPLAVHPRVGGNTRAFAPSCTARTGSSPRGRGTPYWPRQSVWIPPVHPRVGGEHSGGWNAERAAIGSSPRGRGTPASSCCRTQCSRFIPAWAGNTLSWRLSKCRAAVHPRVGRGTLPPGYGVEIETRFIPAWAGNTSYRPAQKGPQAVHPRVGGEHKRRQCVVSPPAGSSPRGRGTRRSYPMAGRCLRFIPAWAGNTGHSAHSLAIGPVGQVPKVLDNLERRASVFGLLSGPFAFSYSSSRSFLTCSSWRRSKPVTAIGRHFSEARVMAANISLRTAFPPTRWGSPSGVSAPRRTAAPAGWWCGSPCGVSPASADARCRPRSHPGSRPPRSGTRSPISGPASAARHAGNGP